MTKLMIVVATIAMLTVTSTAALARQGMMAKGGGGWGPAMPYGRMYNPQTVETLSGEVVSVDNITPMKGMGQGVHLLLKTDKETISVHLGPSWYIENQEVEIAAKDQLQVKGSRITFEGKAAIIATEINKDDKTLMLRDETGIPSWSGWRRR